MNKRAFSKYVKVELLNWEEEKESEIQGCCTSGSISIDGNSSVRRTCSFSLVVDADSEIGPAWALKKKIRVWVGNQPEGEEIKWYNEGLYVITSFSKSENVNGITVNIGGQDKMCLLNGTIGGTLYAEVDFGNIDIYDDDNHKIGTDELSIDDVVAEAVHSFGNESYENIQISDVTDGLQLLQYKGDKILRLYTEGDKQKLEKVTNPQDHNSSIQEILSYGVYKLKNSNIPKSQWYDISGTTLKNFKGPYFLGNAEIQNEDPANLYVIAAIDTTKLVKTKVVSQEPIVKEKTYYLGDIAETDSSTGQDGQVTMADARQALRYAIRLDEPPKDKSSLQFKLADVDGDGDISMADCRLITRMAMQMDELKKINEYYYEEDNYTELGWHEDLKVNRDGKTIEEATTS